MTRTSHRPTTQPTHQPLKGSGLCALRALVCAAALSSTAAQAADLTIAIEDVRASTGKVMMSLLRNDAQMSGNEEAAASLMLTPNEEGIRLTLHDLPPGTYGVQVMHDVNGNGELDANLIGIPKEPWGYSNDAKGRFGPAIWADVQFTLGDDAATQTITLNH